MDFFFILSSTSATNSLFIRSFFDFTIKLFMSIIVQFVKRTVRVVGLDRGLCSGSDKEE